MNENGQTDRIIKRAKGKELAAKINDLDSIVVNFTDTINF